MSEQFWMIGLGFSILLLINILITLVVVLIYFKAARLKTVFTEKLVDTVLLSLTNSGIQLLGLVFFSSSGIALYSSVVFVFSVMCYISILKIRMKLHWFEISIMAITMAIILNPLWLYLLGLM